MKMTCLFVAALSGLALAQDPAPAPGAPPMPPRVSSGTIIAGAALGDGEFTPIPTPERAELGEPLRWAFGQARGQFHEVVRPGPMGYLGVNATLLPRELSAHLSLPEDTGLLVEVVGKDSPAEKAGLQKSDVLAKFDDQILIEQRQLSVLVANKKEGDTVKITYIRKGETHEANIVIGKREGGTPAFGKAEADVLFKHVDGAPLRTFVRRFEIPGGGSGEVRIAGDEGDIKVFGGASAGPVPAPGAPGAPPVRPNDDVKKQLEEIRAMLEALQQKVK